MREVRAVHLNALDFREPELFEIGVGLGIPSQLLSSLPYWATIVVLVAISRNRNTIRLNSPVSLGKPFRPEA